MALAHALSLNSVGSKREKTAVRLLLSIHKSNGMKSGHFCQNRQGIHLHCKVRTYKELLEVIYLDDLR